MSSKETADKSAAAPKWSLLESATWSPVKSGDKVEGILGSPVMGPFGEQHVIGDVTLPHLTALADLSRLPIGTLVRVTYLGEKMNKAETRTYKDFTVETA